MPVVFSPGEPETRPLDPDAIVYTSAQKVADLLGVGPSEAVLMSANAEANAVFVTGGDYRNTGFSVGDTILIYSDADPLGQEHAITAITTSASGVKLAFSASINPGLYETADNAYVQNNASFTNGKTRGMTRAIVEHRIKEIQDRIDNITHNAWRPYLVSAEYINFDTYKPYRRRYYTDYVGTTPLLFRNVQQMLRIELWQGDSYREICGAEARIQLPDDVRALTGKSIVLSPGNGSAAVLTVGNDSSSKWRNDFDNVTSAQNLADLINKEDRVSKSAVNFLNNQGNASSTFTLEGSTSAIAVHNEFFASANADYGAGKLKITSMRQSKAGEVCSIVSTSTDIAISQVSSKSATISNATGTFTGDTPNGIITVNSTTGFAKAGVFTDGTNVVRYTGVTDTTFTGCGNVIGTAPSSGTATQNLLSLDLQGGATSTIVDAITGETSVDRSLSGDQARLRDWWIDSEMGIIYFNNSYPFFEWNAVKVSYIYGERYLEKAIEEAATKMVASELLMSDDRSVLIPEGGQNIDLGSKAQLWRKESMEILNRYKEVVVFS